MAQVKMKGMHLFFIIFHESLPINYTTLKLATYLEEALGNKKYHHHDSGIPNTGLMLDLLDHGSRTNERDPSIFKVFPKRLPINYTTLKLATDLEEALRNKKYHHLGNGIPKTGLMSVLLDNCSRKMKCIHLFFIIFLESLPMIYTTLKLSTYLEYALGNNKYHHLGSGIPNTGLMLVLLVHGSSKNERDPSIFHSVSREFAHELHYFKAGHLPRRGTSKQKVSSSGQGHSKHKINVSPPG
jgi:hypothetical protein